jgi:hypothetical protein
MKPMVWTWWRRLWADDVKLLMLLKTMMLKVVVVVMVVLVQSVSVTILDDAVLKAVVEVDMMVCDDAVLIPEGGGVDVIAIVKVLGSGVKEECRSGGNDGYR